VPSDSLPGIQQFAILRCYTQTFLAQTSSNIDRSPGPIR
jgi:hypothetical protein